MIPHGATTLNLASILEQHAGRRSHRTAVVCGNVRLTYAELDGLASRIAGGLSTMGIGPGDHVALSCPNLHYFPMAYFGILKAGAVVVPLNVLLKPREIAYHLKDSGAKALVCFEGTAELPMAQMAADSMAVVPVCRHLIVMTVDPAGPSPIPDARTLGQLMQGQPDTVRSYPSRPDDTAVILYTSGTTGQPKGAELTHLNMVLNAVLSRDIALPVLDMRPEGRNVTLITLPLFHSTAQTVQMNAYVFCGGTLVLLPRFEPAAVLDAMRREAVTFWIGVPTMHWLLLQHLTAHAVDVSDVARTLKFVVSGGAPMPVELMHRFEQTFGVRVLEGYGLSETAPVAAFNHFDKPSKPGAVGQPVFGVQIRCVDAAGDDVPAGERGEVLIRGHNVMKGYYKRPDATSEAMRDGWFHTGDIGVLDTDGYLTIVDRKHDMILRGGFNVYPRELEEVLMTHPAVALVAVVGVPDEKLGEEVKAFIVRQPGAETTEEELILWCKNQMAAYKYPRQVEFRNELPLTATGKVLKRELRTSGSSA